MPVLDNSARSVVKATYTPITLNRGRVNQLAHAHVKANLLRELQLQPGEVGQARRALDEDRGLERVRLNEPVRVPDEVWQIASRFEPQAVGALIPSASEVADLASEHLVALGQAVLDYRMNQLRSAPAPRGRAAADSMDEGANKSLVNYAVGALKGFTGAVRIAPIGMLHLERIEMAPAGVERGELLATIPLAPGEQTSVVQKEWSVTSQEFSSIVTDSLEEFSEKGVTEKTELAQATESQSRHSRQLGLNTSVSASYGIVTFTAGAQLSTSDEASQSAKASTMHAKEVTSKASSRVRKERKVTITTTTETGQQETTTRSLSNDTPDAMRIDYYSMMRRWRVRLLQYGLRQTYDLGIPEPGATLRRPYQELAALRRQLGKFEFPVPHTDIVTDVKAGLKETQPHYLVLAERYGAQAPLPPQPHPPLFPTGGNTFGGGDVTWEMTFDVKEGYRITSIDATIRATSPTGKGFSIVLLGSDFDYPPGQGDKTWGPMRLNVKNRPDVPFLEHAEGPQKIIFAMSDTKTISVQLQVNIEPTPQAKERWQAEVWNILYNAAQNQYYTAQQELAGRIAVLEQSIAGGDTLTLRQEEREEVMKGVLRWLLGPAFDFMPNDVRELFDINGTSLKARDGRSGAAFFGSELNLSPAGWSTMFQYQEMVVFLQQAIEWENLLYICYPYFWDVPDAWDFARGLTHPDSTRQQFLRSGSARVVLTVRPGYEQAFAAFLDTGNKDAALSPGHPYLTIGNELRAYAQANYPGIPPANPAHDVRPLLTPLQRRSWADLQVLIGLLEEYRAAQGAYPTTAEGLAALTDWAAAQAPPLGPAPLLDPWGNSYAYTSPGRRTDYELSSLGANGEPGGVDDDADITSWSPASLVAEWFEYTPTHGTDIEVNTAAAKMA